MESISRRIAEFSVNLKAAALPAEAFHNAKLAILDCLGVAVLATSDKVGEIVLRLARQEQWRGPCTIWGTSLSAGARDAGFANGTLAHALDYDDGGHVTTYILAASTALAERENVSGKTLLEAFIAGREVRMSLDALFANRFEGTGPGARGWHANGILGPVAAACSASRILGSDINQTLHAIGLAAGSCGALGRDGGTMAKPFRAGHAALTGVTCALLGREGFTADTEALEGPYGLFSALGPLDESLLHSLGQNLGREFNLAKEKIKVKKFAAAARTHAPVEAVLRLIQSRGLKASEVERIECDVKPYPLLRTAPQDGHEGKFSMAYCLAVAVVYGRLDPADFSDEILHDPRVKALIEKVHHRPGMKTLQFIVRTGETMTEPILPGNDLHTWDAVVEKFRRSTNRSLTETQQSMVIDAVSRLEELSSVSMLTKSLQTP